VIEVVTLCTSPFAQPILKQVSPRHSVTNPSNEEGSRAASVAAFVALGCRTSAPYGGCGAVAESGSLWTTHGEETHCR